MPDIFKRFGLQNSLSLAKQAALQTYRQGRRSLSVAAGKLVKAYVSRQKRM